MLCCVFWPNTSPRDPGNQGRRVPGAWAGQVFQFFGLIAGSEYKVHRKKSTAARYQIGSCNPRCVSLSVVVLRVHDARIPWLSASPVWLGLNPHCLRSCGCLFEHVFSESLSLSPLSLSLCAENSFVFGNPLLMNSTFSCLSAVAPCSCCWHNPTPFGLPPCFNVIAKNIVQCVLLL